MTLTKRKRFKFREAVTLPKKPRIDRELGVVYDVRVCGLKSANGRRYLPEALREAISLYEGSPVYFDHPEGESNARSYRDHFGNLFNVRMDENGLIGDLKYKKRHYLTEQFLEDALDDSTAMGLSHNAEGLGSIDSQGCTVVEKITKLHSVDIVDGPATTLSLFEQDYSMNEDELNPTDATEPAVTEAAAGADIDGMLAALVQEIAAHPEWSKADKIAKIKDVINMMEDGSVDAELAEAEDDKEPTEDEMMEQLQKFKSKAVRKAATTLLQESRRRLALTNGLTEDAVTTVFLEQLTVVPSSKALKLIEDRKQVATKVKAQTPKSFAPTPSKPKTPAELAASIDWAD